MSFQHKNCAARAFPHVLHLEFIWVQMTSRITQKHRKMLINFQNLKIKSWNSDISKKLVESIILFYSIFMLDISLYVILIHVFLSKNMFFFVKPFSFTKRRFGLTICCKTTIRSASSIYWRFICIIKNEANNIYKIY